MQGRGASFWTKQSCGAAYSHPWRSPQPPRSMTGPLSHATPPPWANHRPRRGATLTRPLRPCRLRRRTRRPLLLLLLPRSCQRLQVLLRVRPSLPLGPQAEAAAACPSSVADRPLLPWSSTAPPRCSLQPPEVRRLLQAHAGFKFRRAPTWTLLACPSMSRGPLPTPAAAALRVACCAWLGVASCGSACCPEPPCPQLRRWQCPLPLLLLPRGPSSRRTLPCEISSVAAPGTCRCPCLMTVAVITATCSLHRCSSKTRRARVALAVTRRTAVASGSITAETATSSRVRCRMRRALSRRWLTRGHGAC